MAIPKKWVAGLAPLLAAVALALVPSTALAFHYHVYCNQSLPKGGTCPPEGSSEWRHLRSNYGSDPNYGWWVCVDEYLDPNNNGHFTEATCENTIPAEQWPLEEWGYPRVWNDSGTQKIYGEETYP
jgi:hypothetical protein